MSFAGVAAALFFCLSGANGTTPAAACGPNPIVCENANAGTPPSQWDISGAGDPSIQGFATTMSVDQGQTVRFKIKTNANSYQIRIHRLGYYGGMGARFITSVQPSVSLPQNQPACLSDPSTGLVDCGNWAQSASWTVPSDATSGIYLAVLKRNDTGGASHIVFVVRDDDSMSDLLFQTSDTTWQAYNTYGGNSLYTGAPAGRAYQVSYNRPFSTRGTAGGGTESFLFNAEYPMVRWLEANGYNVSYTTGIDTDLRGGEILEHRVFLSVGHDEYWSAAQRANVEAARAAGVHLAFFSGNEVFWKTRWENSIDGSGAPYRTLVAYKETLAGAKIDPMPNVWTGTWRDPRFSPPADGGRPENALTGTLFTVNGIRHDTITVPAAEGKMRFWRNTDIATMTPGQVATLTSGSLGYEWDEDLDNGFRPAGLFPLSSTTLTVSPQYLQDYGATYGSGTATHSLTLYRHSSGALVFGAGTVQWSWGLDGDHDRGGSTPDVRMEQATVNLFADMGVQPGALRLGLIAGTASGDMTPPTASIVSPAQGAQISSGNPFTITGTAADGPGVVAAVEVSTNGGTTWRRATGRASWSYVWVPGALGPTTLKVRAIDDSGNIATQLGQVTVTVTPDTTAPVLSNVRVQAVTNSWATIAWSTDEPADSQVQYGTTTAYGSSSALDPSLVSNHSMAITGLASSTLYHYRVTSRDGAGNVSTSADATFTTSSGDSTQTVTFDDIAGENQTLEGQYPLGMIDWGTGMWLHSAPWEALTTKSLTFAGAGVTGTFTFVAPLRLLRFEAYNGGPTAASITVSCPANPEQPVKHASVPGGQLATIATGWSGTCSSVQLSSSNGWETNFDNLVLDAPPDTTAPLITDVAASVTETTATVTWTTNEAADRQVQYGLTSAYGSASPVGMPRSTTHSVTVSGLTASTQYHYRAASRDAAGNLAVSADFTFTTDAPDTTPPVFSAIAATLITVDGARISWTTNEAADTEVEYGLTTSYGQATTLDPTLTTSHGVSLAGLAANTVYHYRVRSRDVAGNVGVSSDRTFRTVGGGSCPCSIWSLTATPAVAAQNDPGAIEVGVRFRVDVDGDITGLRFYKGPGNTGPHQASLWTNTGTLLAQAPFVNESASGWQEVLFATPVPVTANTTYVASYHSASGRYAVNVNYFVAGVDNAPMHALANGIDGASGVYRYGPSGFPTSTFASSNYWVDAVFVPAPDVTAPTISAVQSSVSETTATISWTTNEPADRQVEYGLTTAYGSASALDTTLGTNHLVSLTGLTPGTLYHYRVRSRDAAGNLRVSGDFTLTTSPPDTTPPVLSAVAVTLAGPNSARISWTTNEASDTQVEYGLTAAYGSSSPLDALLTTSHGVALAGLAPNTLYHYRVRSRDVAGNLAVSGDGTFTTTGSGACPCSIWSLATTPAIAAQNDSSSIEVGMRFRSDVDGEITAVRFYKGTGNVGPHRVNLWTNTGTLLAAAVPVNESASGWQEAAFPAPVPIAAGTTYVASYHTQSGRYSVTQSYFDGAGVDNAPLHALANGIDGLSGVYSYGPTGFPTSSYASSNYWVDVVFVRGPDTIAPTISGVQATVTQSSATISWNTNEPATTQVQYGLTTSYGTTTTLDSTLTTAHVTAVSGLAPATLYHYRMLSRDEAGNLRTSSDFTFTTSPGETTPPVISAVQVTQLTSQGARVSWSTNEAANTQVEYGPTTSYGASTPLDSVLATSHVATISGLVPDTLYHYRVRSRDAAGNLGTSADGTFRTTAVGGCPCSIWSLSTTPSIPAQNDPSAVELGMRFRADVAGDIVGIRFYKGPGNTGPHRVNLWTNGGTLLATAMASNETATGWQEVTFSTPVAITAGTTYVASYHTQSGRYSVDQNYFTAGVNTAPLRALGDGVDGASGVYRYGSTAFPTFTFGSSNYWVDVVFVPH